MKYETRVYYMKYETQVYYMKYETHFKAEKTFSQAGYST